LARESEGREEEGEEVSFSDTDRRRFRVYYPDKTGASPRDYPMTDLVFVANKLGLEMKRVVQLEQRPDHLDPDLVFQVFVEDAVELSVDPRT
jgi:hypothetical protein